MMQTLEAVKQTKIGMILQNNTLTFGQLLRVIRNALGLKLATVCEDTGIESQRMRALEMMRFRQEPSDKDIHTLAVYYGIPYDYLKAKLDERVKVLQQMRKAQAT